MRNKRKEEKLIDAKLNDEIERATLETLEELLSMRTAGLEQRDEATIVATVSKVVVAIGPADGTKMSKHLCTCRVPGCSEKRRCDGASDHRGLSLDLLH